MSQPSQQRPAEKPASGRVTAVRGAVVEVRFAEELPAINEALLVANGDGQVTLEVANHADPQTMSCLAMEPVAGLARGTPVIRTGAGRPEG